MKESNPYENASGTGTNSSTTPMTNNNPNNDSINTPYSNAHGKRQHSQQSFSQQTPYINQLEYFTNNQFSRSFNSLILDDIADSHSHSQSNNNNNNNSSSSSSISRKTINKSPPFNVKQDLVNDSIDTFLDSTNRIVEDEGNASTEDDDDGDFDDEDIEDPDAVQYTPTLNILKLQKFDSFIHKNNNNNHLRKASEEDYTSSSNTTIKISNNSQSSIKRSNKFLNLSIDSKLKTLDGDKIPDEIDDISLHEIDAKVNPSDFSSPLSTRKVDLYSSSNFSIATGGTNNTNNQFKRPHKLVSQSPSPSSKTKLRITNTTATASSSSLAASPQSNLYSPSKLGLKGFKMFKNANKDAIISPNRMTPEKPTFSSKIFGKSSTKIRRTYTPTHTSTPIVPTNLPSSTSTTISNTTANPTNNASSILNTAPSTIPHFDNDSDLDSPSKNRKLSTFSGSSIIIYQDHGNMTHHDHPIKSHHVRNSSNPIPYPPTEPTLNTKILNNSLNGGNNNNANKGAGYDDKENKTSYQFVKPLQTAFNSSGLIKKNSISCHPSESRKLPPETPIKRNPLMMLNRNVPYHGYLEDLHGKEEHLILHNLHQQHALGNTALHHESDISIEVGRNGSYDANVSGHSTLNNSYFKVNNTTNPLSCEKPSTTIDVSQTHPLGNHQLDLDLDFHSDIELDDNGLVVLLTLK